jgi:hypothetical protein
MLHPWMGESSLAPRVAMYTSFSPSPSGLKYLTGDSKLRTGPSVSWGGGGGGGGGGGSMTGGGGGGAGGGGGGGLLQPASARIILAITTNKVIFFIKIFLLKLLLWHIFRIYPTSFPVTQDKNPQIDTRTGLREKTLREIKRKGYRIREDRKYILVTGRRRV